MSARWEVEGPGHWLIVAWQEAFRRVLDAMASPEALGNMSVQAECADAQAWLDWASPAWCQLSLAGIPGAVLLAGAPQPTIEMIGRLISGNPEETTSECLSTFLEIINQTASAVGDAISARMGRRVSFSPAEPCEAPLERDYAIQMKLALEGASHVMAVVPSGSLMEAVASPSDSPEADASTAVALPAAAGSVSAPESAAPAPPPGNLELLLEVELPVSVTFGRTQLLLKDVLRLSSGSIVELNRLAHEPVELLINDSVIARGEVVVVDGNYGIRVTEIVSRQERIRSIF